MRLNTLRMRAAAKRGGRQGGANLVEFAFVSPLLLLLVLGLVDFSLAIFDKAVITNASREGVRKGIMLTDPKPTPAEIQSAVTTYCQNRLLSFATTAPTLTVTMTPTTGPGASGSTFTVQVAYPYPLLLVSRFSPTLGTLNLAATSTMRVE